MKKIPILITILFSIFAFSISVFADGEEQVQYRTSLTGLIEHIAPERNSDKTSGSSTVPYQNDYFSYFIVKAKISDQIQNYSFDEKYRGVIYYRVVVDVNISGINTGSNTFLDSVELLDLYGIDSETINFYDVKTWSGSADGGYTVTLGGIWTRYVDGFEPEVSERELYVKYKLKWQSEGFPRYSISYSNWSTIEDTQNMYTYNTYPDFIYNDGSGDAESLQNELSSLEALESEADDIMDEAIPSEAESQVEEVGSVAASAAESFINDNFKAISFWQRLGEWVLNGQNLGYFAFGLIIVTCINVFAFLIRL